MDDEQQIPVPVRNFKYTAAVTSGRPGAEVVQLLAQVMDSYHDLPDAEREAVVLWFSATYGKVPNAELRGAIDE
jgi:hypothetical protein